jgi:hypothetical protein
MERKKIARGSKEDPLAATDQCMRAVFDKALRRLPAGYTVLLMTPSDLSASIRSRS